MEENVELVSLGKKVILRMEKPEEEKGSMKKTEGGLYVPTNEKLNPRAYATVVARGQDVDKNLKVGDRACIATLPEPFYIDPTTKEFAIVTENNILFATRPKED